MPFKHKAWKLQEAQAEEKRHDILDQQSLAESNKARVAGALETKRNWQRNQQLKTDREVAERLARDKREAVRKEERKRKKHDSKYYTDKKRSEKNVGRQRDVGITEHRYRGESNLRPQPAPRRRAIPKSIEERRAINRKQVHDMGINGQR
ncbi:hypothetical protein LCGC14_0224080 [marine sediment metagenome]|uniref:Uncharacterized protein n=1 Tax=marine sediment metagenome TaxID=412755 RepID=A0A0F9UCC7_9ZZZZ